MFLKSKVTKHKKQLKSSQMSVDAKTEDLASQEKISGSPANLTRTSMLSGTVVKSVPSEKAAETVIDQSSGCDLASSDGMYVTAKKYTNRDFEILFLRDVEGNFLQAEHHWVTVSNIDCPAGNCVYVYDSLFHTVSDSCIKQIAAILCHSQREIKVVYPAVQKTKREQ